MRVVLISMTQYYEKEQKQKSERSLNIYFSLIFMNLLIFIPLNY